MCDRETIEKFKNRFEELAEQYKEAYQSTGEKRHYSMWKRYEDLFDICNLASLNDDYKTATEERRNQQKEIIIKSLSNRLYDRNQVAEIIMRMI